MVSSGMTLLDDESNLGSGFAIKQLLTYRALPLIKTVAIQQEQSMISNLCGYLLGNTYPIFICT